MILSSVPSDTNNEPQNQNNGSDDTTPPHYPDSQTTDRIKNLAYVGTALNETASDTTFMTNFYVAKESLLRFKEGIDRLNLDSASKKGMYDLIEYLDQKIDKRIKYANTTGEKPMT